uniref:Membrane protein insertion efficiency factor n=1 Tax=mine drainage metagenome TaxID=410659 RepID=E6QPN6_9ZZZZ
MRTILIKLIRGYQFFISPLSPPNCRFIPTCSNYACEALGRHGIFRGGWLTIKRLFRCNPWNSGGYDPIP